MVLLKFGQNAIINISYINLFVTLNHSSISFTNLRRLSRSVVDRSLAGWKSPMDYANSGTYVSENMRRLPVRSVCYLRRSTMDRKPKMSIISLWNLYTYTYIYCGLYHWYSLASFLIYEHSYVLWYMIYEYRQSRRGAFIINHEHCPVLQRFVKDSPCWFRFREGPVSWL